MKIIEMKNLKFSYNNLFTLYIDELYVEKGEFVSIIGPNGSGKTTVLKLLTMIETADEGEIIINGKNISKYSKKELFKEISVVPQEFYTSFDFTVESIISSGRIPYETLFSRRDYEFLNNIMEKTDTLKFKDRIYNYLSGGEKQRVMLTRALAQDTNVLLLDEFVSQIDPGYTQQLVRMVKNESVQKNKSVLSVFHDINLASLYSDRIYIFKEGIIKYYGTPEEIITKEIMKEIYDIDCIITYHPIKNKPQVIFEY
jgi:iron complex transport system ATP-binding protein